MVSAFGLGVARGGLDLPGFGVFVFSGSGLLVGLWG